MARLGIEFELILKNRLIIPDASTTWRLRTSLQPYSQKDSQGPRKVEDHLFPSPLSFSLQLLWASTRTKNRQDGKEEDGKNGHGQNVNISVDKDEKRRDLSPASHTTQNVLFKQPVRKLQRLSKKGPVYLES
jgi:hypothetical protein